MPPIVFECFVLPHGRRENMTIEVSPDTYLRAEKLLADGFVFQCEQLRTGEWSYTIVGDVEGEQQDVAIEIGNELGGHTASVEKMIREFDI